MTLGNDFWEKAYRPINIFLSITDTFDVGEYGNVTDSLENIEDFRENCSFFCKIYL